MFLYFRYIYFFLTQILKLNTKKNIFLYTNALSLSWNCRKNFRKSGEKKKFERRKIFRSQAFAIKDKCKTKYKFVLNWNGSQLTKKNATYLFFQYKR